MCKLTKRLVVSLFGLVLLLRCGGGSSPPPLGELPPGAPPLPTPSDPWFGVAGNVLVSDRNHDADGHLDFLWVGFNSSAHWQNFLVLHNQHPDGGFPIGGQVVVDSKNPLGFYFDPNTVVAAEIVAEGAETSLDAIKQNPSQYANFSPGWSWYVPAIVEGIR